MDLLEKANGMSGIHEVYGEKLSMSKKCTMHLEWYRNKCQREAVPVLAHCRQRRWHFVFALCIVPRPNAIKL